jgi:hypothetical protein
MRAGKRIFLVFCLFVFFFCFFFVNRVLDHVTWAHHVSLYRTDSFGIFMHKSFVFKQNNIINDRLHIQAIVVNNSVNSKLSSQLKPGGVWKSGSVFMSSYRVWLVYWMIPTRQARTRVELQFFSSLARPQVYGRRQPLFNSSHTSHKQWFVDTLSLHRQWSSTHCAWIDGSWVISCYCWHNLTLQTHWLSKALVQNGYTRTAFL